VRSVEKVRTESPHHPDYTTESPQRILEFQDLYVLSKCQKGQLDEEKIRVSKLAGTEVKGAKRSEAVAKRLERKRKPLTK
jgi:hypothetical protein